MNRRTMKQRHATLALSLLVGSLCWTGAMAQGASAVTPAPSGSSLPAAVTSACTASADPLPVQALYGRWQMTVQGGETAAVVLHQHPDYEGGIRGTVTRAGGVAQLAGDLDDDGMLTLDESQDGIAISATWSGVVQAGSCGEEIKGTWRNARDDNALDFVLRKTADEN